MTLMVTVIVSDRLDESVAVTVTSYLSLVSKSGVVPVPTVICPVVPVMPNDAESVPPKL